MHEPWLRETDGLEAPRRAVASSPKNRMSIPPPAPIHVPRPPHILLVDDVRANLVALSSLLEPMELPLTLVSSGREALAFMLREEPAVVLLDVQMPGMDGFETARMMASIERTRHVPIIFVTALSTDAQHRFRGYREGAVDYLAKPLDPDVLRSKVRVFAELFRRGEALRARDTQLAQQRSEAFRDDLLAAIAHELRTPLNGISSWAQLLAGGTLDEAQRQRAVETISRNARLQARLLADVLDVARLRQGALVLDFAPCDLSRLVAAAVSAARPEAEAKRATLSFETAGEQGERLADAARLRQIIDELLAHALRHAAPDGLVSIRLEVGEEARLTVHNDGEGIGPQDLQGIFEPMARWTGEPRAAPGLGLGLFLCRGLSALHGGTLVAESPGPADGATFVATWPLARVA